MRLFTIALAASAIFITGCATVQAPASPSPSRDQVKQWRSFPGWEVRTYSPAVDSGWIHSLVADPRDGVWFAMGPSYIVHISRSGKQTLHRLPEGRIVARIRASGMAVWLVGGQSTAARVGKLMADKFTFWPVPVSPRQKELSGLYDVFPDPAGLDVSSSGRLWFTEPQGHAVGSFLNGNYSIVPSQKAPGNISAISADRALVALGDGSLEVMEAADTHSVSMVGRILGQAYLAADTSGAWATATNVLLYVDNSLRLRRWRLQGLTPIAIAAREGTAVVLAAKAGRPGTFYLVRANRSATLSSVVVPANLAYDSQVAIDKDGGLWLTSDTPKALIYLRKAGSH